MKDTIIRQHVGSKLTEEEMIAREHLATQAEEMLKDVTNESYKRRLRNIIVELSTGKFDSGTIAQELELLESIGQ